MALMEFREPNQVKWVGVRPAHRGTQKLLSGTATNETITLYTIPAGKTLYLVSSILDFYTAVVGYIEFYIDNGAVELYRLGTLRIITLAGVTTPIAQYFSPPLEMAAGWRLRIGSSAAGLTGRASAFGWEE